MCLLSVLLPMCLGRGRGLLGWRRESTVQTDRVFSFSDLVVGNWHTGLRKRSSFEKEGSGWVLCGTRWVLDSSRISWLCPVESRKYTHHSTNKQSHCGRLQRSGLVLLRESTFFASMKWEPGHQIKAHDVKLLEPDWLDLWWVNTLSPFSFVAI